MTKIIVILLMVLTVPFAHGQRETLKVSDTVLIRGLRAAPITLPVCDGEGTLYFRFFLPPSGFGSWVRVNSAGEVSTFEVPKEYSPDDVVDAKPGPDGLYLLLQQKSGPKSFTAANNQSLTSPEERTKLKHKAPPQVQYLIVSLDEHGKENSVQKLDLNFWPRRIAVFDSGSFLIVGDREDSGGNPVPVTSIVDSRGRILKEISLSADIKAEDAKLPSMTDSDASKLDEAKKKRLQNAEFLLQLSRSPLQRGDDGRIYLVRVGSATVPIYAIRESGEVERISIPAPQPDAKLTTIRVSHGTIMLYYVLPKKDPKKGPLPKIFDIWDLGSHKQIAEYFDESTDLGYALGCYEPERLTFLKPRRNGGLELVTATPQ